MQQNKISILSTRPLNDSSVADAEAAGITIDTISFIETEPIRSGEVQQRIKLALQQPATVIFTSMNAVEIIAAEKGKTQPAWAIYCIGNTTAQLIKKYFGELSIAGTANSAIELAKLIAAKNQIDEVIFFCGDQRRDELPEILRTKHVRIEEIIVYHTIAVPNKVEKSFDGVNFRKIGFVGSAGNSNSTKNYTFTDPQRAVEFNYYRLKLVDIDNTFDYSDVVLVKNAFGKQEAYLAGNPITNSINIQFAKTPNGKVSISIYDIKGSKIYDVTYDNYTQTSLQINTANKLLAHGVYSVKVETAGKIYSLKAIK